MSLCTQAVHYDVLDALGTALVLIIQMHCMSISPFPKNHTAIIIESFQLLDIGII